MLVSNITVFVDSDYNFEPALVPMALRIGSATFFFDENESGVATLDRLLTTIQQVRDAFVANRQEATIAQ